MTQTLFGPMADNDSDGLEPLRPGPPIHRPLASRCTPVEALRGLRTRQPTLLESRTRHPAARHSILPFNPIRELIAYADRVEERGTAGGSQSHPGDPWAYVSQRLSSYHVPSTMSLPFTGGWVGFLSHEAAAWILRTPLPAPAPPARPRLPLAHFRFYPDAVVFDHESGDRTLLATDCEPAPASAQRRLEAAERLLDPRRSLPHPSPAARALAEPLATLDATGYQARVRDLQALVRNGDCFQANLAVSYAYPWQSPPSWESLVTLYDEYAASNPGAWGGFYEAPGCTLLSSSPECLAEARDGILRLRPIAGTRPRGSSPADDARWADELRSDEKERAEHAMLVDLARNDAATVCRPGSVHVPNFGGVERYRHVMHLVSEVEGVLRGGITPGQILNAVFPGGTVTGAPKRRAVQRIAELEAGRRGPYTGALGYVSLNGATQWNLLIRTLVATPSHLTAHAGCGIVEGSRPAGEWAELEAKARAQVEAATGLATPAPERLQCGTVEPGASWRPILTPGRLNDRRVLIVDFEDSFVHNLADYCAALGAQVRVRSANEPVAPAWETRPTHLLLSPGPGRPEDFPSTIDHVGRAEELGTPILGVCLGHQALCQALGARIVRHPQTVHGKASSLVKTEAGRTDAVVGAWPDSVAARYHSLVATELPPRLEVLAQLDDGTCMAVRARDRPWWGLQFHPESILTRQGARMLAAFLEVSPRGPPPR